MKRIFVSQRVDEHPDYGERRDALDQKWTEFLWHLGFICLPTPNHADMVKKMLIEMPPAGILLTGGPIGTAPERDALDECLITYALSNKIPLLGVCRGMQSIILHHKGTLKKVEDHIAVLHMLDNGREVKSYHGYGPDILPDVLIPLAYSTKDGSVEQIRHVSLPMYGIMWHPERENPFKDEDFEFVGNLFRMASC